MGNLVKIDINFFNKPLYFQNIRCVPEKKFIWTDIEGFEYHSGSTPPDYIDALILFYLLLRSQEGGYVEKLSLTRYEIIKACGFTKCPKTYKRVQDSLERWSSIYLKFHGTFYDNKNYLVKFFHILKGSIDENTQKVEVTFDSDWLLKIKESNFFKYLNFVYYKSLKRPMSRRMYELLSTKCYNGNEWHIRLTKLGEDIPIYKRKVRTREGEKEVLYASDVLVAIKPAFNEINDLAKDPNLAEIAKFLPGDVFTVQYRITGEDQERVIHIKTHRLEIHGKAKLANPSVSHQQPSRTDQPEPVSPELPQEKPYEPAKPQSAEVEALLGLLKKRSANTERTVAEYCQAKGVEYVKSNILYANQKATESYFSYLQQSLKENWAEDWVAEKEANVQNELKRSAQHQQELAEDTKRAELKKLGEQQRPAFCKAVQSLDDSVKEQLWELAEKKTPVNNARRNMAVKLDYIKILVKYLNDNGHNFVEQVSDFDVARTLAWQNGMKE